MSPPQTGDTAKTGQPAPRPNTPAATSRSAGRRRAFAIFFVVLLLVGGGIFFYWLHARNFESTDDAFVEMHLDPYQRTRGWQHRQGLRGEQPVRACGRCAGGSGPARFPGGA